MGRSTKLIRAAAWRCLAAACALGMAWPAVAQSYDVNTQPVIIEPLPQPNSPVRSQGGGKKRGSDAADVGRDLDAASRRVQSDNLRNEIDRRDTDMERDRVRTERLRATSSPQEAASLRQEYGQRLAEHERWRTDQERQRQDQQPKEAKDPKAAEDARDTYRTPTP